MVNKYLRWTFPAVNDPWAVNLPDTLYLNATLVSQYNFKTSGRETGIFTGDIDFEFHVI